MTSTGATRMDLRARITLAILAITGLGCTFFAFGIYLSNEGLEDVVLERQVRDEFETLKTLSSEYPVATTVESALIHGYVGRSNPDLPPALSALAPGDYHSFPIGDRRYQILVADEGAQRFYISYDITEWEDRERQMILILVIGVVLVCIGAVWLGYWISRQIVAPVTQLASRVTSLRPDERNIRIANEFEGAEVHEIARAFDHFMERLDSFVSREQMFSSAASHELRTPLAVMQGAADVLSEQPGQSSTTQRATRRILRASREMREFIDALLVLSREPGNLSPEGACCELSAIVMQLVDDMKVMRGNAAPDLDFTAQNSLLLNVPPSLPTIVISNLLRNAIEHTQAGSISIILDNSVLTVKDTGSGIPDSDREKLFERDFTTRESGRGMGLHIVKRICDQCGWQIKVNSQPGSGTTVRIDFGLDHHS